jgi:hypothetical protein
VFPRERARFLIACFVAYWAIDELPALLGHILSGDGSPLRLLAKAVAATLVDLTLVALIVLLTVPWATRLYVRRRGNRPD